MTCLSEQHFTEGDETEDDLDDDNIDYSIIDREVKEGRLTAVLMEEVRPLDMVCRGISINCIRMCPPIIAERNSPIRLRSS